MKNRFRLFTILILFVFIPTSCSEVSDTVSLPDYIYNENPNVSTLMPNELTEQEREQVLLEASQSVIPDPPVDFSEWLPEELERYNFIENQWNIYLSLADEILEEKNEEELISIRTEIYKLKEENIANRLQFHEWFDLYTTNQGGYQNLEQKRKDISLYLIELQFNYDSLLSVLPYDDDYHFELNWDVYYGEIGILHRAANTDKEERALQRSLDCMNEVKRQHEEGNITGQQGLNAILNIWGHLLSDE